MSVYITGDIHGDLLRFSPEYLENENVSLEEDDIIIVTGDFGIPFGGEYIEHDEKAIRLLSKQKYIVCFCDGCHDNYSMLNRIPDVEWYGGLVNPIAPNIIRLKTGHIYDIEGNSFFVFGGGVSSDKEYRTENKNWWKEEFPSEYFINSGIERLIKHESKVDYVISHTPPVSFETCNNEVTAILRAIKENIEYKEWFSGCVHIDRYFPDEKLRCLCHKIHKI